MTEEDSEPSVSELQVEEENELSVIQLCGLVEELSYGNSALKTETEMFEKYYSKLEPKDQVPRSSEIKTLGAEFAQLRGKRKSRSRKGTDHVLGLSVDQKCELVQKELEDTKEEIRHMRANAEWDLQRHEAIIEEAEMRWTEVQGAVQEFKKDILKTISKKKGSILATEKVMKYIEDMNRQRKEEVGEALHEVDFQQLQIENAQFLDTIEARNQELIRLKLVSGNTLQVLNTYKSKLQRAMEMSINLDKEILLRNELLEKIERETLQAEEDQAKAEALNKKLRKQLAEFRAPQVMVYVREKILNGDLEKTIKTWERKVEIAEVSHRFPRQQSFVPFTFLSRILFLELRIQIFGLVTSIENLSYFSSYTKMKEGCLFLSSFFFVRDKIFSDYQEETLQ
ncbi:coiled-coil domain-containing protein 113 isoform X2 [Manis pentadactyla]|uniref:coiled-coil domain-containing protein 113 isoform X2 n=1 Tax=Manis pentadactyla TaxID=143292 RepID=UPI00255C865D|nr:coiled-coil domain-containing protein 113 isoform X2 [Manis pentadactyla]